MESQIHLEIVTPNGTIVNENVDYIGLPGNSGELGILPHHIPLLSILTIGKVYYKKNDLIQNFFVSGGFVDISENHAVILTEAAEHAKNIDIARAQEAQKRAEERISKHTEQVDMNRAKIALERAVTRLNIAQTPNLL